MVELVDKLIPRMAKKRLDPHTLYHEAISDFSLESRLLDLYQTEYILTSNNVIWRISNFHEKKFPTCEAAPEARGTPLHNELKTLVLETEYGQIVANLPATRRLSLNHVKLVLGVRNVRLADPEKLPFPPGQICALTSPVSDMPTLICNHLFSLDFLTTNDTTTSAFFLFNPYILTLLNKRSIVNISS